MGQQGDSGDDRGGLLAPGVGRPSVQLTTDGLALLAFTYRAGIEDSPDGFRRLQQVRKVMAQHGLDLDDRDDERVIALIERATDTIDRLEESEVKA